MSPDPPACLGLPDRLASLVLRVLRAGLERSDPLACQGPRGTEVLLVSRDCRDPSDPSDRRDLRERVARTASQEIPDLEVHQGWMGLWVPWATLDPPAPEDPLERRVSGDLLASLDLRVRPGLLERAVAWTWRP